MSRKTRNTIIQVIVFAAIGGGIIWYMLTRMSDHDRTEMSQAMRQARLWMLAPVFVAAFISHWSRAKRWQLLMEPLGLRPSTPNTLFAVLIGYVINLVPPRAGEVAKCTILARTEKVPPDKMIGTIVAERAWDILCLLVVIAAGLFWQRHAVGKALQSELMNRAPSTFSLLITGGLIGGTITFLAVYYQRHKHSRIGRFISGLGLGVSSIFRLRHRGLFMLHTLLIWSMYLLQIQLGFWALPVTESLSLGPAMLTLVFGSLAMVAAPGGIGLYPYLVAKELRFGYGLSIPAANAFGWVSWIAQTGILLFLGLISFILLPIYNRKPHNAQAGLDQPKNF